MTSRADQGKLRKECFLANKFEGEDGRPYLRCHICHARIDPATQGWEAEHTVPHAWNGQEVMPAHVHCHKLKTKKDVKAIAKAKRTYMKRYGVTRAKNPMPGGKRSNLKKKLNGQVVRRDEE